MNPNSQSEEAASFQAPADLFSAPETAPAPAADTLSTSSPDAESLAPGEASTAADSIPLPESPEASADPLTELADRAAKGRLSPAEEERAASLLKATLLEGRKGVEHAVVQLPKLPWIVGVNGVSAAWPEMKTLYRARLIGGLAKIETDAARRVRLSLARGLFKQDVPASVKLAVGVSKEIRDKETGAITSKNAQIFANVLIGRAKPWIAQIPLADLKPADGDLLVHCTIVVVFGLPHAPTTQLGVLKWVGDRLGKLHPLALETAAKAIARWNGKWQAALRKDVPDLPEGIASALKGVSDSEETAKRDRRRQPERPDNEDREHAASMEPVRSAIAGADDEADLESTGAANHETADTDAPAEGAETEPASAEPPPQRQPPRQRPVYESKTVPSQSQPQPRRGQLAQNFNLSETLKQIDAHVAGLRSELQFAQNKLRQQQRDDERKPRRGSERTGEAAILGEPTLEELARLNRQLEARIMEQQQRIEELLGDSEDRAASMSLPEAAASPDAALRALLSLKLKEDYEDFAALESEAPDIVVQQHYRSVLRHVFEVIRAEGVRLEAAPPPPA